MSECCSSSDESAEFYSVNDNIISRHTAVPSSSHRFCFLVTPLVAASMVRKKQQHPRALLGPPDARQTAERQDVTSSLVPTSTPATTGRAAASASADTASCEIAVVVPIHIANAQLIQLRHLAIYCKELSATIGGNTEHQYGLGLTIRDCSKIAWEAQNLNSRSPVSSVRTRPHTICSYLLLFSKSH